MKMKNSYREVASAASSWESAAAFGNAVVNAILCWFSDMRSFFSGFTVLLIIPERFNLVDN